MKEHKKGTVTVHPAFQKVGFPAMLLIKKMSPESPYFQWWSGRDAVLFMPADHPFEGFPAPNKK